jgi:hypothetical protein
MGFDEKTFCLIQFRPRALSLARSMQTRKSPILSFGKEDDDGRVRAGLLL